MKPFSEAEGMIPRAIRQIFERIDTLKAKNWSYSLSAM